MICPICKDHSHVDFSPFCSGMCKNIDLVSWLKGEYRIPTREVPTDENQETGREES